MKPPSSIYGHPKKILNSLPTTYRKVQNAVLSVVFPWTCPGCGLQVAYPASICGDCTHRLRKIEAPFCSKCGAPFPVHWQVEVCPECSTRKSPLSQIRSVYYYEGLVQKMILEVKYARRARHLRYLSEELFQCTQYHFPSVISAIVPVPLHYSREWFRTFNQAGLMAKQLSRLLGVPVWKALLKPNKTEPQSSLSGIARRANLRGAFRCKRPSVSPRSVLLVDDVVTTGATLEECAKVLRKHGGVRKVYAVTVARAVQQW